MGVNFKLDAQNGVISPKLSKNQLRAVLTWGERPRDVDAHLQVALSNGQKGQYQYFVHNYNGGGRWRTMRRRFGSICRGQHIPNIRFTFQPERETTGMSLHITVQHIG